MLAGRGGGFEEGCRNKGAYIYAQLLSRNHMKREDLVEEVCRFGTRCRPPLSVGECRAAAREGAKAERLRNATISDWLEITPREAQELGVTFPDNAWRAAGERDQSRYARRPLPKREEIAARRNKIQHLCRQSGSVPSCREMTKRLQEHGFDVQHSTVHQDYKALDLTSEMYREQLKGPGKEQKESKQLPLIA